MTPSARRGSDHGKDGGCPSESRPWTPNSGSDVLLLRPNQNHGLQDRLYQPRGKLQKLGISPTKPWLKDEKGRNLAPLQGDDHSQHQQVHPEASDTSSLATEPSFEGLKSKGEGRSSPKSLGKRALPSIMGRKSIEPPEVSLLRLRSALPAPSRPVLCCVLFSQRPMDIRSIVTELSEACPCNMLMILHPQHQGGEYVRSSLLVSPVFIKDHKVGMMSDYIKDKARQSHHQISPHPHPHPLPERPLGELLL